jgi:hypothetical protein
MRPAATAELVSNGPDDQPVPPLVPVVGFGLLGLAVVGAAWLGVVRRRDS